MNPIVLLDPQPRLAQDIFSPLVHEQLLADFHVIERAEEEPAAFYARHLPSAEFIVGQPDLTASMIEGATALKAIINVESNFLQNMDYNACFQQKIHVLTVSPVFAQPVAELALGLALALARDIPQAHQSFVESRELYGLEGNQSARLLNRCNLGFVGFGDLGRAILKVFAGFSPTVRVYDPWISPEVLRREGIQPCSLEEVLMLSDVIPVVATVTDQSSQLLGQRELALIPSGALLLILSRAEVVDFDALVEACNAGSIRAATDVFPVEPLPPSHPIRSTSNLIFSAHRAGALQSALFEIGERTLADLQLMKMGLPPQNCKRAEYELVHRVRSKPVDKS